MLLSHSSLAVNQSSHKALCEALPPHCELAARFHTATVSECEGSWTDALRASVDSGDDIPVAAPFVNALERGRASEIQTIALAKPLAATLGLTDLSVMDDAQVRLSDEDSRALCEAANVHVVQDGVSLRYVNSETWFVSLTQPIEVLTEHPMFLVGENLRQFLPRGRDARLVEKWMNELQMLFFNHPVNAVRQANGLPPINFVWLYGFSNTDAKPVAIEMPTTLFSDALKRGDVAAWQAAWATLEPKIMQADGVIIGDAFPRLKLTFQLQKKGLFSWFAKKPTLAEVLMRLQANALSSS